MARLARVVVTGFPYHITHRGNRRGDVFFSPADRDAYRAWLAQYAARFGLQVWAYCLMTNHVHLLAVPEKADSLARAIGRTHLRHALHVNRTQGWSGHLWANRFYSTPLDDAHLWTAAKYIESNPVRAGLVRRAEDYEWSSARAHVVGKPDALLSPRRPFPDPARVGEWGRWLAAGLDEQAIERIRRATATGRPCGSQVFVAKLEALLDRLLRPQKPGRKRKSNEK